MISQRNQALFFPLPVVIRSKTGANATQYLYALGTRPLAQNSGAWEYLLADALGSVRQIVAADGNVTLAESYEPYGSVLSSHGTASSIFAYAGEQVDTSGLVYLRARYMNPRLGIFLARDPWSGDAMRPGSMNGFSYASANPINRMDPSGKTDQADVLGVLDNTICSNPCVECIPFASPIGKNIVFVNLKWPLTVLGGYFLPWLPADRNVIESVVTDVMDRYSSNLAFGSLPSAWTQLKVSEANPIHLYRSQSHGNSPAAMAGTEPPNVMKRRIEVYNLLFTLPNNTLEPQQAGTLAHEIAHYWDFDNRTASMMEEEMRRGRINWYRPPAWNSAEHPFIWEYFADAVERYLYPELDIVEWIRDSKWIWTDDIGGGLNAALGQRDGLYVNHGQISAPRMQCNQYGGCEIFPPEGKPMRDIYDFLEDQISRIRP